MTVRRRPFLYVFTSRPACSKHTLPIIVVGTRFPPAHTVSSLCCPFWLCPRHHAQQCLTHRPHQNRIRAQAVCDGWSGRPTQDAARRVGIPLLTDKRSWHNVKVDLAIEDIRAREYRGTTGNLGSMDIVSAAPSPGAKLITRRSQVRVLAPLQNRRSEAI